jgi:hypothetical protein
MEAFMSKYENPAPHDEKESCHRSQLEFDILYQTHD